MSSPPASGSIIIVVHGDQAFASRVSSLLAGAVQPRVTGTPADLAQALADHNACVAVVDQAGVQAIVASMQGREDAPPVLALGCSDAEAADAALDAGASLALRDDATAQEITSAIRVLASGRDSRREAAFLRMDLEHQRALLLKDDLTAAGNRRFFDVFLAQEVEKARACGGKVSLVFMDIDNLKAVNVRHGHSMGSLVLREAAMRLINGLDKRDRVMRYGGDEFCVVLPGRDAGAAVAIAEKLRSGLAASPFATEATGGVVLTASFGIAEFPAHAEDAAALVRAADAAMLAIKDQKDGIQVAASA